MQLKYDLLINLTFKSNKHFGSLIEPQIGYKKDTYHKDILPSF